MFWLAFLVRERRVFLLHLGFGFQLCVLALCCCWYHFLLVLDMTMLPNTALEPTATAPSFYILPQIHACGCSRRGSALDR
jgi:hypothetical protein